MNVVTMAVVLILVVAVLVIVGWLMNTYKQYIPLPFQIAIYAVMAIMAILFVAGVAGVGPQIVRW